MKRHVISIQRTASDTDAYNRALLLLVSVVPRVDDRDSFLFHFVNPNLRVVVIGAGGRLGAALVRQYAATCEVAAYNRAQLDLGDLERLGETVSRENFDVLINAAALTNVDYCEDHHDEAMRLNAD